MGDRLSVTLISSLRQMRMQFCCKRLPRRALCPQCLQFENNTNPQHRNLKFNLKNRLSKFDLSRNRLHSKNPSRLKRHHATPISIEPPAIPTRNGEPEPAMSMPQEKSVPWKEEKAPAEKSATPAKQEVLQFEPVTRGRFEKSEPTIIEGEDLDVPTYLRKHIKVK